jgi:hypothetical protein
MGAPYNQLQQLVFAYSGREIGVDKFKPYTFGNEKSDFSLSFYGSMLQMPIGQSRVRASLSSGSQIGLVSDRSHFSTRQSGSIASSPADIERYRIGVTGVKDGHPRDLEEISLGITGQITRPEVDFFSNVGLYSITGTFVNSPKEVVSLNTHPSGEITSARIDKCSMTFVMFTGTYNSGVYVPPPQNYPITGLDSAHITFSFFTGTYQGA